MAESFSVVMTGKVAEGQDLAAVKSNVAKLFKLGDAQLEKMFSGKAVAVRKGIDRQQADRICAALLKAGAEARVKTDSLPAAKKPAATPKPATPKPATQKSASVTAIAGNSKPAAAAKAKAESAAPAPATASTPAKTAAGKARLAAVDGFKPDLECPRCGHEQSFSHQCEMCKMDLTLHIQRLERKEKARQARRAQQAAS